MAINLLVLPLFIKNLGAELYGIWVISNVVLGYLNVFDFGFTQGLQKYVAQARGKGDHQELSEVVVSGVGLLLCIGLLLGGVFFIGAQPIVNFFNIQIENQLIAQRLLQISALFCVIMWPLRIIDVVLNASMRIKELSFLNAFKSGAQSIVMLAMVTAAIDILLIKWVTAVLMAVCSAYGLVLVRKYAPEINWNPIHFKFYQLKRMHRFSLGMFYAAIIGMLSIQVDNLVIGKLIGMAAVTAYTIASTLFKMVQQFSNMVLVALMPTIYNLNVGDKGRLVKLLEESIRFRTMVATFFSFGAILVCRPFTLLWVGNEYLWTVKWALLFLSICPFIPLANISAVLRGCGYIRVVNIFVSFKIITNLILSVVLVSVFGIGGPIIGTVISFTILGEPGWFVFLNKNIGASCSKVYSNIAKTIAIFGVCLLLAMIPMKFIPGMFLGIGISIVCYVVLSVVLGLIFLFSKEERSLFTRILTL